MRAENERSPTKKGQLEIKSEDEDSPAKRKQIEEDSDNNNKDSSSSDEELPVKRIERQIEFGDILQDFDDLNEPACMDKILMYLEEIKDEDYFFMEVIHLIILLR